MKATHRFAVARLSTLCCVLAGTMPAVAGIYSGPTDTTNAIDPAIPADSARFVEWADAIDPTRTQFAPNGSTVITPDGINSLGDLDSAAIAAGTEPGFLTVTFPSGIKNGPGADFAVFENGGAFFAEPFRFAELAYVEVSTNGTDFARFPSIALNNEADLLVDFGRGFAGVDVTNVYNLAGKHENGFGTPLDLDDLALDPLTTSGVVDVDNIQYVRLVDIPGDGSFFDSQGNPVLDPWLTTGSGGFDFRLPAGQGVGVINAIVPEPTSLVLLAGLLALSLSTRNR